MSDARATAALAEDGWRIVAASVRGPAHVAADRPREDAFAIRIVSGCAIAVVCDGAGSAACAAAGARRFSQGVMEALASALGSTSACDSFPAFQHAVMMGIDRQRAEILRQGLLLSDHHATLVAAVVTPTQSFIAHLGDGMAGVAPDGCWPDALLSLPQNGEFANETFFVTEEDWRDHLRFTQAPGLGSGVAVTLLTDGAMPFVVGADERGLEPEFMGPVSKFLSTAALDAAAEALAGTLDSAQARQISNDDKTLVWIALDGGLSGIVERLSFQH